MTARARLFTAVAVILYAGAFALSLTVRSAMPRGEEATDVGRIVSAKVDKTVAVRTTEDVAAAIREARREGRKVSVAGTRHSMGGQTFYEGAVVLDMRRYDDILDLDTAAKKITVQSGATWEKVQEVINPHHLSIRVMQSQNIFTVGGSLGTNIHGRDPSEGSLIETVDSFRLMTEEGKIMTASRSENADLFRAAIGGYGLLGVILDATLRLTDDVVYTQHTSLLDYKEFPDRLRASVESGSTGLVIARISTAPSGFLREMYMTEYMDSSIPLADADTRLKGERAVELTRFVFGLQRKYGWGKNMSWSLQERLFRSNEGKPITRNNAMRPESGFLEYRDAQKSDLLQEYFVPLDRYPEFVDGLRTLLREEPINLVNITVRYMPRSDESLLAYSRQDSAALVLLINEKRSPARLERLKGLTQKMIGLAEQAGGTYYLTYQPFASKEQFRAAYPAADGFKAAKLAYDKESLFMNEWYAEYLR
ncbi:FAD-binding protein [Paenibacillus sp. D9]|uniref:FAD-binding oxidoreductase n=1 Tax=Paenibacillus sp. D9 TaxID=665792 RepID=UPI00061EB6D7|nr:FAD-binding oxidoreductase [Paenibacillus sp. D9]KKC48218.1 FAD-binding protein [Paenibacillus sp. D9]